MRFTWFGLIAASLLGCTDNPDVEDSIDDVFLTDEAKADAFGVEDWSPDGAAVLRLISSASKTKLHDDVGLSTRVANNIVAKRPSLGGTYTDLADLDAVPYVGKTVFNQLLKYVTERKLFKPSLRVPLLIDDGQGNLTSIATFSDEARAAGLQGFARYTFVDADTNFSAKMDSYDQRLQALATAAHMTIEGEMIRYASSLGDYQLGTQRVCFLGPPEAVADVSGSHGDGMMSDMYSIWGWRYKTKVWTYDDLEDPNEFFGSEWTNWNTSSDSVLIETTASDSGDDPSGTVVPPCR